MLNFLTEGESRFSNLRKFNLVMGVFHLIQAIIMLAITNDYSIAVTTSFIKTRQIGDDSFSFDSSTVNLFEVPVGLIIALFLFISAIAHFLVASPFFYNWYVNNLNNGINHARWYEYSISSSLMIVVIALLVGFFDAPGLILLFFLNASMIWFGWMMEKHNMLTEGTDWTSFILGCITGIVPWIVIGWYFIAAITEFEGQNPIPKFVYGILISLFIFFNIFAVNMFLQYKKIGPWKNYLFGEAMYIILSLVAKSLLAWQVWSGTLRGDS